jgi:hypothetical protein
MVPFAAPGLVTLHVGVMGAVLLQLIVPLKQVGWLFGSE